MQPPLASLLLLAPRYVRYVRYAWYSRMVRVVRSSGLASHSSLLTSDHVVIHQFIDARNDVARGAPVPHAQFAQHSSGGGIASEVGGLNLPEPERLKCP